VVFHGVFILTLFYSIGLPSLLNANSTSLSKPYPRTTWRSSQRRNQASKTLGSTGGGTSCRCLSKRPTSFLRSLEHGYTLFSNPTVTSRSINHGRKYPSHISSFRDFQSALGLFRRSVGCQGPSFVERHRLGMHLSTLSPFSDFFPWVMGGTMVNTSHGSWVI